MPSSKSPRKWSKKVTETSDALDLQKGIFKQRSAMDVARSLKASAVRSRRRKADAFRSAMSMLNFYINRAGTSLTGPQRKRLELAKQRLRQLFHKPPATRPGS